MSASYPVNEKKLAVLDLGSNSVRMEIYRILSDGRVLSVMAAKEFITLSEHMGPEKTIKPEAVARAIITLKSFREILQTEIPVHETIAIATAALRQAKNQKEVLKELYVATGFAFHVITGVKEAEYDATATRNSLPYSSFLLLDTGGGSAEIALVKENILCHKISIPYGSVVLSEKWHLEDQILPSDLYNALNEVMKALHQFPALNELKGLPLIMIGGSNRQLAQLHMFQHQVPKNNLHGYMLPQQDIEKLFTDLVKTNRNERLLYPGMKAKRVNTLIGGLIPLIALLLLQDFHKIIVSKEGLRYGVCMEYYERMKKDGFFE